MSSAAEASLERLKKRLESIPKGVKEAVKPALEKSADELVATMKQLAPVDTGALRDSITATPAGETTPPYAMAGDSDEVVPENTVRVTAGNTDVRYPHLVEYGTAEAAAQPFFWPAYRLAKSRITNRVKRAIGKAVREEFSK